MTASPSTILRIKEAIDLAALVQEYVPLKKQGARYMAACPFHREKTASFGVHPDGFFMCFGCGAKGDAITFVSRIENISKSAAIRLLSERTGIPLDGKPQTRAARAYDREEREFAEWFWRQLKHTQQQRLTAYVMAATDEECEAVGAQYRKLTALDAAGRRALAVRVAGAEDRKDFAAWKADEPRRTIEAGYLHLILTLNTEACQRLGFKDPDDFIRKYGGEAYMTMINSEYTMRFENVALPMAGLWAENEVLSAAS